MYYNMQSAHAQQQAYLDDTADIEYEEVFNKLEDAGAALANAGNKLLAISGTDFDAATASDDAFAIIANVLKQLSKYYSIEALVAASKH